MPTLIAQANGFDALNGLQQAFTTLVDYLPQIIGALLILLIGYIIAKLVRKAITKLLQKLRFDDRMKSVGDPYVGRFSPGGSPAALVGLVIYAVLMVFVLVAAVGVLNIPAVTTFMNQILSYLPNVIASLLIFLVAVAVAGAISGLVQRTLGDTPVGRLARAGAPGLVMAIAVFMILNQLNIAPVIVTATYIALIGALALGSALAFGLGGRDAAAEMINSGYRRAQQESGGQ